jgi:hypothetical protein
MRQGIQPEDVNTTHYCKENVFTYRVALQHTKKSDQQLAREQSLVTLRSRRYNMTILNVHAPNQDKTEGKLIGQWKNMKKKNTSAAAKESVGCYTECVKASHTTA